MWLAAFVIFIFRAVTVGVLNPAVLIPYSFGLGLVVIGFILIVTGQHMRKKERLGEIE